MGHQCAADSCQEPQALLSIEKEKPVHCEATAVFLSSGGCQRRKYWKLACTLRNATSPPPPQCTRLVHRSAYEMACHQQATRQAVGSQLQRRPQPSILVLQRYQQNFHTCPARQQRPPYSTRQHNHFRSDALWSSTMTRALRTRQSAMLKDA